ncbi:aspartate carbamoyltransferase catalytic subunit [Salimicrobium sp. PL1-032A]|uniref:aspartate carbamoyltransferase catalytic subunit n=1 Tax=Salimicrobium sp. PL1-032A TaxID=3095364 RepID=UPI0032614183
MKDLLSMNQLTNEMIYDLLDKTHRMKKGEFPSLKGTFAANLFLEPSTRTKQSFYVAEKRLQMEVLDIEAEQSSILKGETLYDSVRTLEALGADVLTIRQSERGALKEIASRTKASIINAGDGTGEHPTQSLLDLYTIYEEFGTFENIIVTIAGDIKHSRVARSNAYALEQLGATVQFSAPDAWREKDGTYVTMQEAVETSDVVMLLRIQKERHQNQTPMDSYLETYGLTKQRASLMKPGAIIMHPAPVNRGVEIDSDLVECSRSRIFEQMNNGVYMRMAIIQTLMEGKHYENHKRIQMERGLCATV